MSSQALHFSPAEIELLRRTIPELRILQAQQRSASEAQNSAPTNALLQNLQNSMNKIQSDVKDLQRNMQKMQITGQSNVRDMKSSIQDVQSSLQKVQSDVEGIQKIPEDIERSITETRSITKDT